MNLDAWNSLTDNQKKAYELALDDMVVTNDNYNEEFTQIYYGKVKDAGIDIYFATPEQNAAFRNLSLEVALPQALEVAGPKGQEIVDLCQKIMDLQDKSEYKVGVKPDYDWVKPGYGN
jgi:TRAP-type C4-dicarboxylate transport system substrate-binding protein